MSISLWIGVALLVAIGFFVWSQGQGGARVSGEEARALVEDRGATLVDVRTAGEFDGGHLPGAANIPVQQLGARLGEIPKDKPVVVYCQQGPRAAAAAARLRAAGYDVHNLGGIGNYPASQ